ncbi:MAG: PAS domain S-box protein [Phycisphaerae bacterium]|nr:PAS domain S-box protein [Phycisphaerae bacterium]
MAKSKANAKRKLRKVSKRPIQTVNSKGKKAKSRTRKKSRSREESQNTVLEMIPHGIEVCDATGTITFSNSAHAHMLGYKDGELVGKKIWDVYDSEEKKQKAQEIFLSLLKNKPTPTPYVETYATKKGRGITTQVDWNYKLDENGRVIAFVSVVIDITGREQAEKAWEKAHEQLRAAFDTFQGTINVVDRELNVIDLNDQLVDACKLGNRYAALGKKCYEAFYNRSKPCPNCLVPKVLETGQPHSRIATENAPCTFGGDMCKTFVNPILGDDGKVWGAVASVLDITDLKKAEEERRENALKLQQIQKIESLGVLAGGIAHDFNNLLMVIQGNADLAISEAKTGTKIHDNLEDIRQAASEASKLARQMLACSGKVHFLAKPVCLNEIAKEMRSLLKAATPKHVSLKYDLGRSIPQINADASQIHQLLMSLGTNAVEAIGGEKGQIIIRTRLRHVSRELLAQSYPDEGLPEGQYVCLEVADNGSGMEPHIKKQLFDPFFSTKFTGRGLGLAAALGIVRGHGGAFIVQSEPDNGSLFQVLFPPRHDV